MADRFAVLVFKCGPETTDESLDEFVAQLWDAPKDWTFQAANVVTDEREYRSAMWGAWE